MIYICGLKTGTTPSTAAFSNRGLSNLVQSPISKVPVYAKPHYQQVAYAGYKDNIEAFLYATATRMKVTTSSGHYPMPAAYTVSTPIAIPRIIIKLLPGATAAHIEKFKEKLKDAELEEVQFGKGGKVFTIGKPTLKLIAEVLPKICHPRGPGSEGFCQLESAAEMVRVYQCVDAFLATNTYHYKASYDKSIETPQTSKYTLGKVLEIRMDSGYYRSGFDSAKQKESTEWKEGMPKRKIDGAEVEDLTPKLGIVAPLTGTVMVAKPSPKPSSTSWGAPRDVPNHGGLLFPYFPGMVTPDSAGIRHNVMQLFLRNFGSTTVSYKDSMRKFRDVFGSFSTTDAGIQMSHILEGISLALDSQTQLFLLFDRKKYLGFCLLGEEFSVLIHNKWFDALPAADLKTELSKIQTHEQALEALGTRLEMCKDSDGDILAVDATRISSPSYVCDLLSRVKPNADTNDEKELSEIIARLTLSTEFKKFRPQDIAWAVQNLTIASDTALPDDLPIHIPLKGWSQLGKRSYKVLASFGSTSFSFRNSRGTEIRVPKPTEDDPFVLIDQVTRKPKHEKFIVYEKPVALALQDWDTFVSTGSMRMDFVERAAGSRAHVFQEKIRDPIWDTLKVAAAASKIATGVDVVRPDVAAAARAVQFASEIATDAFDFTM